MSAKTNSVVPLEMENVLDPRLEAMKYGQDKLKWTIFKGSQNQNWVQQQSNAYSTSSISWNFNTQSDDVLIDRRLFARVQFKMSFTGTSPIGQPLLVSEFDAPRAFPLASITQSLSASINGTGFQCQYGDCISGMLRYNTDFDLKNLDLSQTPSTLDKYQNYADGVGTVRNPLSTYGNGSYEMGRGGFQLDSIDNPVSVDGVTPTTSTVVFTVVEPLIMSPFLYSSRDLGAALYGVKNIGVTFNLKAGKLDRIWSHAAGSGANITSTSVDIGSNATEPPQLLVNYLNPPLLDSIGAVPKAPVYQYYKTDTYVNDLSITLAPNESRTVTNNSIQLSTVPESIYIWASLQDGEKTYESSDAFLGINSLSVNYLNVSGQFSTMSKSDLYALSVKNGLQMSWTEFSGKTNDLTSGSTIGLCGSVIKLTAEDLSIPDNLASGVNVNSQLGITANLTNLNQSENVKVQFNVVLVYDGVVTVSSEQTVSQVGIINQADVIETRAKKSWVDYKQAQKIYGGSIFSKLANLAKGAYKHRKDIAEGVKLGQKAYKAYKGEGGALMGGAVMGGAKMTPAEMRRRLMEH